jgi:hypothetical protein
MPTSHLRTAGRRSLFGDEPTNCKPPRRFGCCMQNSTRPLPWVTCMSQDALYPEPCCLSAASIRILSAFPNLLANCCWDLCASSGHPVSLQHHLMLLLISHENRQSTCRQQITRMMIQERPRQTRLDQRLQAGKDRPSKCISFTFTYKQTDSIGHAFLVERAKFDVMWHSGLWGAQTAPLMGRSAL